MQQSSFQKAIVQSANQFVINASDIGLSVTIDQLTQGDGNCFYRAVTQQLQRPEISRIVHPQLLSLTHGQMRHHVVSFIRDYEMTSTYIQNFKEIHESTQGNVPWNKLLSQQEILATYATELFISATAFLVGIDIHITSNTNTIANPVTIITHNLDGIINNNNTDPVMLIGSISQVHFQSLLPVVTVNHGEDSEIDFTRTLNYHNKPDTTDAEINTVNNPETKPAADNKGVNPGGDNKVNNIKVRKNDKEKKVSSIELIIEKHFEEMCATNGVVYLLPLLNETRLQTKNRIHYNIGSYLFSHKLLKVNTKLSNYYKMKTMSSSAKHTYESTILLSNLLFKLKNSFFTIFR